MPDGPEADRNGRAPVRDPLREGVAGDLGDAVVAVQGSAYGTAYSNTLSADEWVLRTQPVHGLAGGSLGSDRCCEHVRIPCEHAYRLLLRHLPDAR